MVSYRYIGYGVTDSTGVATLSKNPSDGDISGYTGVGAGEVDFVASLDNPIESGSLQSEPYTVYDCIFKDVGTSSDYGTWTSTDFTGTKIERNSEYTTLIPEDTWETQNKTIPDTDLCIEFDVNITFSSASYFIRLMGNGSNVDGMGQSAFGLSSGVWSHVKLSRVGTVLNIVVDGETKNPHSINSSLDNLRIVLDNTTTTNMKYKNFVIYPI